LVGQSESAPLPIEPELSRLEAAVDEVLSAAAVPDEAARQRIATRLRALVSNWAGPAEAATGRKELTAASAEDLFEILDGELESSS